MRGILVLVAVVLSAGLVLSGCGTDNTKPASSSRSTVATSVAPDSTLTATELECDEKIVEGDNYDLLIVEDDEPLDHCDEAILAKLSKKHGTKVTKIKLFNFKVRHPRAYKRYRMKQASSVPPAPTNSAPAPARTMPAPAAPPKVTSPAPRPKRCIARNNKGKCTAWG